MKLQTATKKRIFVTAHHLKRHSQQAGKYITFYHVIKQMLSQCVRRKPKAMKTAPNQPNTRAGSTKIEQDLKSGSKIFASEIFFEIIDGGLFSAAIMLLIQCLSTGYIVQYISKFSKIFYGYTKFTRSSLFIVSFAVAYIIFHALLDFGEIFEK